MLDWLQNPYVAIALAIGAMFFGYFFGLFEGRGQGYKRRKAEEALEEEKPQAAMDPTPVASPILPPVLSPDETPMLDVSMDTAGSLRLKLDGQSVEDPPLELEQRKRLIAVLTMVRPWLEAGVPAPGPARPAPAPSAPVRSAPAPEPRASQPARPASPPAKEGEEPADTPQSIVAQIDSILQAQMAGTPLIEKGIRLHESPEGGVVVWVGIKKYEGIEDVPDEQIKAAIRAAITAWENKYTPGI